MFYFKRHDQIQCVALRPWLNSEERLGGKTGDFCCYQVANEQTVDLNLLLKL